MVFSFPHEDLDNTMEPPIPSSPVTTDDAIYLAATLLYEVPADLGKSCGTWPTSLLLQIAIAKSSWFFYLLMSCIYGGIKSRLIKYSSKTTPFVRLKSSVQNRETYHWETMVTEKQIAKVIKYLHVKLAKAQGFSYTNIAALQYSSIIFSWTKLGNMVLCNEVSSVSQM